MKRLLLITALLFMGSASAHDWDDNPSILGQGPDGSGLCVNCDSTAGYQTMIQIAQNSLYGKFCFGFGEERNCPIPDGSFVVGHVAMYETWGGYDGEFHALFKLVKSSVIGDWFVIQQFHTSNECQIGNHDWPSTWPPRRW